MAVEKKDVEEAEIADTVGPAANYAIAKNFFNFEPLGPIDSDVPVVYELELFLNTTTIVLFLAGNKNPMNSVFNQILNFFAMKAYDANLTAGELKIADFVILMVDEYREIERSFLIYLQKQLIRIFSARGLTKRFHRLIPPVLKKGPVSTDLNKWIIDKHAQKYAHATKKVKLKVVFGKKLINEAVVAARDQIQSRHNRLYQPPHGLASGKNMTAMFKAMNK